MESYYALPVHEQVNLLFLISCFIIGIVTITIFSLRWKYRKRDVLRSKGGSLITAEFFREYFFFLGYPFLRFFEMTGLSPNSISAISLALGVLSAALIAHGVFFWGGWALAFSGLVDTIDGQIARTKNKASLRGAYLDSVFDRYADFAVFSAFLYYFGTADLSVSAIWYTSAAVASLTGAALISYSKERGANLGGKDERGLMQRGDRLLIICVMCIYDPAAWWLLGEPQNNRYLALVGLTLMAVVSHASAINRIRRIARQL